MLWWPEETIVYSMHWLSALLLEDLHSQNHDLNSICLHHHWGCNGVNSFFFFFLFDGTFYNFYFLKLEACAILDERFEPLAQSKQKKAYYVERLHVLATIVHRLLESVATRKTSLQTFGHGSLCCHLEGIPALFYWFLVRLSETKSIPKHCWAT